ncbi:MAG TPA: tRNA (adenosine(37)-N6)-threonylcarbamoyltransferase complex transferase subunit TsaD [Verrucomicrobiae bacterium]|jgi:N6-L-threonylcarbamoyladenine synthase|nr:tRNA (adenosine(37)-N6)-threonylcarbamoyltransferase complex transferase subunit TsaD [Verrucomicrobiae bacterium]
MLLAGIETSCDETSVAVVHDGHILANVVSSQIKLHAEYGGVVPELATREHLRNLLPVAGEALAQARIKTRDLDAVAATQGPGLPPALVIGFQFGQALAYAVGRLFIGINHHEAHLYSPWITKSGADFATFEPNVSLIVSGGHTLLVHVKAELDHQVLGSTVDDAAGECFDKTAKLVGLGYPGGPEMDRLAETGNPKAFDFPRPMLKDPQDDFSFSGLKTAVRYFVRDHPEVVASGQGLRDLCASVQAAIVEVLVQKTVRAARRLNVRCITASGGVTCNRVLRAQLEKACRENNFSLRLTERALCTDNAGMIAILAERKLLRGEPETRLNAEIRSSWDLTAV